MKEFRTTGMIYEIDGILWTEVCTGGVSAPETCVLLDLAGGKIIDHDERLRKLALLAQERDVVDHAALEQRKKGRPAPAPT